MQEVAPKTKKTPEQVLEDNFHIRLGELVKNAPSLGSIFSTLTKENYDLVPNFYRTMLYRCQAEGRFSYTFNQAVGDSFRAALNNGKLNQDISPEENIKKKAEELSQKELQRDDLLRTLEQIKALEKEAVIAVRIKYIFNGKISEDQEKLVQQYNTLNLKILNLAHSCPATLLLYFYQNKDLEFLWGMKESSTFRDVATGYDLTFSQTVGSDW